MTDSISIAMLLSNSYNPDDRVRHEAIAMKEAGYNLTIYAWDRECLKPIHEELEGINIIRARISSGDNLGAKQIGKFLQFWLWLFQQMIANKPSIIHCHDFDTLLPGVLFKFIFRKVILVFDAHENYYALLKPYICPIFSRLIVFLETIFVRNSDLIISACENTKKYYEGKGAKNSIVVGNYKNRREYSFSNQKILKTKKEIGIQVDQLVIVYIGLLSDQRNVLPLIRALKNKPNYFLILGGKGDLENQVRSLTKNMNNVFFPGYIHPDLVPLYTSVSDIVYYGLDPSHGYAKYNAPNKLYESLAAGKAILATDAGGELSSVVQSSNCGLLIKQVNEASLDEALNLLSKESIRFNFQENAANTGISQYNWEFAKESLINGYLNITNE